MTLTFRALSEDRPGPKWAEVFAAYWPAYERWWSREGLTGRPTYLDCRQAIRTYMPELSVLYDELCELAGGGDRPAPSEEDLLARLEKVAAEVSAAMGVRVEVESATASGGTGLPSTMTWCGRPVTPEAVAGAARALAGLGAFALFVLARRRRLPRSRWFLRALVVAAPAAVIALETGWITTEVGRQPWIVHGLVRTADAVTDASWIWTSYTVLAVVYAGMTVATVVMLRSMSRRWALGEAPAAPYGPPAALVAGDTADQPEVRA